MVRERIPLQRSVAVVTDNSVVVRPGRGRLVGPLLQALLAVGAVWLLVWLLDAGGPLWLLAVLLVVALIFAPLAVLGVVYNVAGSSITVERAKQSVHVQQGFLGLGLGTADLVPFWRIDHIEVTGDYDQELSSGQLQDFVHWDVRVVKDNGRTLGLGTVIVARPFAEEGRGRAERLARAVAELAGVEARVPALPVADAPAVGALGAPVARRPAVRRRRPPAPPAAKGSGA